MVGTNKPEHPEIRYMVLHHYSTRPQALTYALFSLGATESRTLVLRKRLHVDTGPKLVPKFTELGLSCAMFHFIKTNPPRMLRPLTRV